MRGPLSLQDGTRGRVYLAEKVAALGRPRGELWLSGRFDPGEAGGLAREPGAVPLPSDPLVGQTLYPSDVDEGLGMGRGYTRAASPNKE